MSTVSLPEEQIMEALQHNTAEQGSTEWLEARKSGIGSSDAAIVLGLSNYANTTPIELWEEKTGRKERDPTSQDDVWFQGRGHALEPLIRQHYSDTFNRSVINIQGTVRHKVHEFLLASLDGYTPCERLVEFKTATSRKGWGEAGTDEVPYAYLIQVQHAMLVTGLKVADVGVTIAGLPPVYYVVEADAEIQQLILESCQAFWNHVINNTEPDPKTIAEKLERHPITGGKEVYATDAILEAIDLIEQLKAKEKELEEMIELAQGSVKNFLIDSGADIIMSGNGQKLATWKEAKGKKGFDAKRLLEDNPTLHAQYAKVGNPSRSFKTY